MGILLVGFFSYSLNPLLCNDDLISKESEHFTVYYEEGMLSEEEAFYFLSTQEKALEFVNNFFHVQFDEKVKYYLHPPDDSLNVCAKANPNSREIFMIWSGQNKDWQGEAHELTHIVSYSLLGVPHGFFGEGAAVAVDHAFKGDIDTVNKFCRAVVECQKYHPLDVLLDYEQLEKYWSSGVWEASSFTYFLIGTYGIEKFKQLWKNIPFESSSDHVKAQILLVYGLSLGDVETEWIQSLEDIPMEEYFIRKVDLTIRFDEIILSLYNDPVFGLFSGDNSRINEEWSFFDESLDENEFERAEQHLQTLVELIVMWKGAIDAYIEALQLLPTKDYPLIIGRFEEAQRGYEIVGDDVFSQKCLEYIQAFSILQEGTQFLENQNYRRAEEKLVESYNLFQELGEEEYTNYIEESIQTCRDEKGIQRVSVIVICVILTTLSVFVLFIKRHKESKRNLQ